jgi:5-methylcytosine-specific restriction enzyme A
MTRTLLRACLDCRTMVRGKSRCVDCQARRDRAKRARRPDMRTYQETERRRRLLADHRATIGDWCPGLEDRPAHPSADLVADHVVEVAVNGLEMGPLRVLCRSENSRRSANLIPPLGPTTATPRPPNLATQTADGRKSTYGPVVA